MNLKLFTAIVQIPDNVCFIFSTCVLMGRARALLKTLTYFIRPLPVSHPVCDVDAGKHARCFSHRAPYLPHAVVLHGDFPKEEVDELAVIDRLDKIRL